MEPLGDEIRAVEDPVLIADVGQQPMPDDDCPDGRRPQCVGITVAPDRRRVVQSVDTPG